MLSCQLHGGDRIAHLILHPNAREILCGKDKTKHSIRASSQRTGLDMEEIQIGPNSPWLQRTVSDVEAEAAGRLLIVAILRRKVAPI